MNTLSQLSSQLALKDLARVRVRLNGFLAKRIKELYPNAFLAKQIQQRIEKGRKIRSLLFLTTLNTLTQRVKENTSLGICLAIEMTHAASCLVDDILDGDDTRHGYQSSQAILGTPVSALQAHFLSAEALNLVSSSRDISKLLVTTYQRLTLGEMYDIFLPEPASAWMCDGYDERVYQKTSAMFEFSFETAAMVAHRNDLRQNFKLLGHMLGKLYQVSNDYYDMQPANIQKRHRADQSWRITFSLPVACYLELYGVEGILAELAKGMLTYDEWMKFLEKIWTPDVQTLAWGIVTDTQMETRHQIKQSGLSGNYQTQLFSLVDVVVSEDFWYHSITE